MLNCYAFMNQLYDIIYFDVLSCFCRRPCFLRLVSHYIHSFTYQKGEVVNTQNIKIYDNGGKTFDRYTAIIDRMFFGFSENPFSPLGFSQFCGDVPKGMRSYRHLGKKVSLDSLSADVRKAILDRMP